MKFPVCDLSSIVNPGMYVVVTTDKEHALEVENLEKSMAKEMLDFDGSDLEPKMCVAVKNFRGNLNRAIIEKEISKDLYEVFLVDYGKIITAHRTAIVAIKNKDFVKVEPLAFIVKLHGVIPAKYFSFGDTNQIRACKEWSPEAQAFIDNFFKFNSKVVVQSILIQQRVVYGDLFVKDESIEKYVSLRKLLCRNKFCAYSLSAFLKRENITIPSEGEEMSAKMEMVKKWQHENFGDFKPDTYRLPSPKISPHCSMSDVTTLHLSESSNGQKIEPPQEGLLAIAEKHGAVPEKPGSVGLGRGNLKLMIAEMKEKEQAAARGRDSPEKAEAEAPMSSRGRGFQLRRVLDTIKAKTPEAGPSHAKDHRPDTESERFTHVGPGNTGTGSCSSGNGRPTKVERAVVKPGEFSEFSDSPTEASLVSTEEDSGPPPLVCSKKDSLKNSVSNGERSVCRSEIGKGERESSRGGPEPGRKESSGEQEIISDCPQPNECWCCERTPRMWEQSSAVASNNCWAPFVVFEDSVVESISNFGDLPIQPSIIKNLERRGTFKYPSQVQRWAIPTIRKQHNTVLISGSKTGKTLSYLIPLMDYVQDECYFEELSPGNGPSVVIVASSAFVCESIYYTCHHLLGHMHRKDIDKSRIKVVMAHGSGCEKENWVNLTNGCDVLICTPPCLVRLLEHVVLTNFDRLTCLVLDEADIICELPFRKSVLITLEKAQMSTKGRHYQKILCGEKWTPNVEKVLKSYVKSYTLVIGSYSEAVIYRRLRPTIVLVEKEQKAETLVGRLQDKTQKWKVVIFCEATEEAVSLSNFLAQKGINALLAHEKILAEGLKERERIWKNSSKSVLIITDGVLGELNIRDAQLLVHYGLPSKSKTNFFLRYSTVLNSYRAKHSFHKKEARALPRQVHTVILIDDHNHYQLPHIAEFVERLGVKMPQAIVERCEVIRRMTEVAKLTAPICRNLLTFGRCRNWRNCPRRHALVGASDSPSDLPTSGWINFEVVKTLDASLLSARLLEHVDDVDGVSTKFENRHVEIERELAEYFKVEDNRRPVGRPVMGTVCAVMRTVDGRETFHRGRVIEYLKVDKHETPLEVRVKLLDDGDFLKRKSLELYELPEDLAKLAPTAIDIRLVGLQPNDFDVSWSQVAGAFFDHLMTRPLEPLQYWSAKILLALDNTLFVDPVRRKQFLPHLNIHVFDMLVHTEMLNSHIAVPNKEHLPTLVKLLKEAGMEPPKKQEKKKKRKRDSDRIQPQWAFLDSDVVEVKFLAAENTSVVFLQPKKNEKLLEALEQDCQREGEKREKDLEALRKKKSEPVVANCAVGEFCLARFEDGQWNRGRIESDNDSKWCVFFIDHGDFLLVPKQDVVPISGTLLLRLPCQAIECRLAGIEDQQECPVNVLQEMYAFSEDGAQELYAHVIRKESKGTITGGRKYDVNLVDWKGVSLNKLLVECGMARGKDSERCYLEDKEVQTRSEEECSEEEEEAEAELEEQLHGECLEDNYFANLGDDVFEGEEGLRFLREFASKLLPDLTNGLEETPQRKMPKEPESVQAAPPRSPPVKIHRPLEPQKKRRNKNKTVLHLKNREVLTPQVLWCQTQEEVRLRILLGNVSDYSLECTPSNFSFRCVLGEKFYAADLKLFGAVNPQLTRVWTKAFHVSVVLAKMAFPMWPRLPLDEGKHRWISLDVEGLGDEEKGFSDKIKTAKRDIESGNLKSGTRSETIRPYSDTEGSDEESKSDTEDSDEDV